MSLEDKITEIVADINPEGTYKYISEEEVEYVTQAILQAVRESFPGERRQKHDRDCGTLISSRANCDCGGSQNAAYNQAIQDAKTIIGGVNDTK